MKKILWLFLFNLFTPDTFSQGFFDPLYVELNGNVKSMHEINYKDSLKNKVTGYIKYTEFNRNGKIVEYRIHNSKNILLKTRVYFYDINGNDSISFSKNIRKNTFGRTIYKTDENQNLISEIEIQGDSTIVWEYRYKYDSANNMISKNKKYFLNEKSDYETLSLYDSSNNLIEWKWLNSKREVAYKKIFKNKRKLRKEEIEIFKDKISSIRKYKYNIHKNIKKAISYSFKDSLTTNYFYKYNKKRMVIRETIVKQNGETNYYTFKYDNQNNWIEYKYFKNNNKSPEYIMTRKFEYY